MAFRKMSEKKWLGEPIDVFVTEVKRLARCANVYGEVLVKRVVVNGLPESVAKELRAMTNVESCGVGLAYPV